MQFYPYGERDTRSRQLAMEDPKPNKSLLCNIGQHQTSKSIARIAIDG